MSDDPKGDGQPNPPPEPPPQPQSESPPQPESKIVEKPTEAVQFSYDGECEKGPSVDNSQTQEGVDNESG